MPRQVKSSEAVDDVDFVINTSDEETESGDESMEEEEDVEEVLDVINIKPKGKRATKKRVAEKTVTSPPTKRLTTEVVRTSPPSIKKERQQMSLTLSKAKKLVGLYHRSQTDATCAIPSNMTSMLEKLESSLPAPPGVSKASYLNKEALKIVAEDVSQKEVSEKTPKKQERNEEEDKEDRQKGEKEKEGWKKIVSGGSPRKNPCRKKLGGSVRYSTPTTEKSTTATEVGDNIIVYGAKQSWSSNGSAKSVVVIHKKWKKNDGTEGSFSFSFNLSETEEMVYAINAVKKEMDGEEEDDFWKFD